MHPSMTSTHHVALNTSLCSLLSCTLGAKTLFRIPITALVLKSRREELSNGIWHAHIQVIFSHMGCHIPFESS